MRRVRSTPELQQQLQEQLHLLQSYCTQFDKGDWLAAKPMSTSLRVLLHHKDRPQAGQGSLLAQLGLRGGFWLDSTRIFGQSFQSSEMSWPQLLIMEMSDKSVGFKPKILGKDFHLRKTSFMEWWTGEIGNHPKFGPISRKKLLPVWRIKMVGHMSTAMWMMGMLHLVLASISMSPLVKKWSWLEAQLMHVSAPLLMRLY